MYVRRIVKHGWINERRVGRLNQQNASRVEHPEPLSERGFRVAQMFDNVLKRDCIRGLVVKR